MPARRSLLVLISDGYPHGRSYYEGQYAIQDTCSNGESGTKESPGLAWSVGSDVGGRALEEV